ncbi:MAG: type II toxin-antitoxin system RatA family toxin [Betaproteobacteria bacterium]|jgi:ribosome-associated toxin RatA of RatAB toxin-antitoxin module
MHRVERSVLVPYSAEEMFGLVAAIKDYPTFLPWCAGARVRAQPNGEIEATVQIDYRGVRSEFTTRNHNESPRLIQMHLVDGPFRRLWGEWTFTQLRDDACKVHLNLHFQFASGLIGRAVAPVFEAIAGSLVEAFTRRAEAVYGQR